MGKIEMVPPAADALPAGLRLRAARDGPVKPLGDNVAERAEEVVEEVGKGAKLLLWADLRKFYVWGVCYRMLADGEKPSGSSELDILG